jgi:uncharacterized membrane protein
MEPTQEQIENWRKDNENWKYKFFYYNKEDNRLLVDKRNPNYGATINFAHKKSSYFFIGLIAFLILVVFVVFSGK